MVKIIDMTDVEKYALVLFKDYTMLELKAFHANLIEKSRGKAGGAVEPWESVVLMHAIELHRVYRRQKLKQEEHGLFQQ